MAFQNIDQLNLGKFLQIAYTNGIRNQLSQNFKDFEDIKSQRVGNPNGKQLNFLLQTALGTAAVQYMSPGSAGAFPRGFQASSSEHSALYKEIAATVQIELNLWKRAQQSPAKYLEPLAFEMQSKSLATKRRLAADLHGDGSGVIGQVGAACSVSGGNMVVPLSVLNTARGHVGFFEYGDILILRALSGAASALNSNLATEPAYWKVISRSRKLDQVVLQPLDASFAPVSGLTSLTTSPAVTEVFYRHAQPTIPDLTAPVADWGTLTEVIAGFESLLASDGRTIHGITMSGVTGTTEVDAAASAIDVSHMEELLSNIKVAVGAGVYKYKKMLVSPEARSALILGSETDRRFGVKEDLARGSRTFGYQHEEDFVEVASSEYCPKKRAIVLPSEGSQGKVMELHFSDFAEVSIPGAGSSFLDQNSDGAHLRSFSKFMEASGTLINKHPAACGRIVNFTV